MIKPGTVCMIRGVPPGACYVANGQIVTVIEYLGEFKGFPDIYQFEPSVMIMGEEFDKCRQQWLYPLDPCEDDLAQETLERLDEQLRETFINTLVEKL